MGKYGADTFGSNKVYDMPLDNSLEIGVQSIEVNISISLCVKGPQVRRCLLGH